MLARTARSLFLFGLTALAPTPTLGATLASTPVRVYSGQRLDCVLYNLGPKPVSSVTIDVLRFTSGGFGEVVGTLTEDLDALDPMGIAFDPPSGNDAMACRANIKGSAKNLRGSAEIVIIDGLELLEVQDMR